MTAAPPIFSGGAFTDSRRALPMSLRKPQEPEPDHDVRLSRG